jgi:hypothetical protein
MKYLSKYLILIILLAVISGYFIFSGNQSKDKIPEISSPVVPAGADHQSGTPAEPGHKKFVFNNFHGSTDISDKFEFQYPENWHNDGQYFSPQRVEHYTLFTAKAPVFFDLILAEVFNQTEFYYQIETSKRKNPDTTGMLDGREFKKYDLIDYGSYGGESAGWVKIFVGPKIKIDGKDYYLVFHWEEKPLAEYMAGNSVEVFDNMMLTLKFF